MPGVSPLKMRVMVRNFRNFTRKSDISQSDTLQVARKPDTLAPRSVAWFKRSVDEAQVYKDHGGSAFQVTSTTEVTTRRAQEIHLEHPLLDPVLLCGMPMQQFDSPTWQQHILRSIGYILGLLTRGCQLILTKLHGRCKNWFTDSVGSELFPRK